MEDCPFKPFNHFLTPNKGVTWKIFPLNELTISLTPNKGVTWKIVYLNYLTISWFPIKGVQQEKGLHTLPNNCIPLTPVNVCICISTLNTYNIDGETTYLWKGILNIFSAIEKSWNYYRHGKKWKDGQLTQIVVLVF